LASKSGASAAAIQLSLRLCFHLIKIKAFPGGRSYISSRSSLACQVRISPCRRCCLGTHVGVEVGDFCCSDPIELSAMPPGDQDQGVLRRTLLQLALILTGVSGPDFALSSVSTGNSRWRRNRGLLLQRSNRAFGKASRRSRTSLFPGGRSYISSRSSLACQVRISPFLGVDWELTLASKSGASAAAIQLSLRQSFQAIKNKAFPGGRS
jgi:hypothetical protein